MTATRNDMASSARMISRFGLSPRGVEGSEALNIKACCLSAMPAGRAGLDGAERGARKCRVRILASQS